MDIKEYARQLKLDAIAKKELERVIALVSIQEQDFSVVVDYAKTFSEVIRLEKEVAAEGEVVSSANGGLYMNPRANLLINAKNRLFKLRRELGFSPRSRVDKDNNKEGELEDLMK